jgi:hypothetical protein
MGRTSRLDVADGGKWRAAPSSSTLCHMGRRNPVYMVERCAVSRRDGAMLIEGRVITRPIEQIRLEEAEPPAPIRKEGRPEFSVPGLLTRLLVVAVGFGLAFTGWMLMMTVILAFIGLPLFFFGLAVMQTQEH